MSKRALSLASDTALTVSDFERLGGYWLDDGELRQLSKTTIETRRFLIGKFLWFLRQREVNRVSTPEVRSFFAYVNRAHESPEGRWGNPRMNKPVKATTVETYFIILGTLFSWIVEQGELEESPMASLKPPIVRPDQIQPFTHAQIEALTAAARKTRHPRRDEAIALILLDTGMRASELCALKMRDIDLSGKRCTVLGKGNKTRTLPFGVTANRALWNYLRERERGGDDAIFTSDAGRRPGEALTRSGLFQMIERLGNAAKIEAARCSPHTFRHTFAIEFLRNGGNVFTLKVLLGHTSLTIVNRYVTLAQADIESQHRSYSPVDRMKKK